MKRAILALLVLLCLSEPVLAADYDELTAVGQAVGIRLQEDGITITGFTEDGHAKEAGLKTGDRILKINGREVRTAAEIGAVTASGGKVCVTVERNGTELECQVEPVLVEGRWLLGLQIRDCISGIGTITFYDRESGAFGALGHGVNIGGTAKLMTLTEGIVVGASVTDVKPGKRGEAGQLMGEFDLQRKLGTVSNNTERGIFGTMCPGLNLGKSYEVAEFSEIHTGEAAILSNVSGREVQEYEVRILKIYPNETERNLLLEVTDSDLQSITGGIVQGMSGSPIIQDGKLIGAVTHVLVNDPTTGYGIFIENMLDAAA